MLIDPPASGAENMALDAALLEAAETGGLHALRLYAWDPPAISFGRNEPALRRYDRAAIASRGLATVRRPTGGRAVWHHHEVTYAVAAPASTFGSLQQSYLEIHTMIAEALRHLGATVELAGRAPAAAVSAGACFASPAGGEVVAADGRKVVGSAQVRAGNAFLQHGSILLSADQDVVAGVTVGVADPPSAAGLAELLESPRATWESVSAAIVASASDYWSSPRTAMTLPGAIRERSNALLERFGDDAWTWRR